MKLAVTITDTGHVANAGGDAERRTAIIDVPYECVPKILRDYLLEKEREEPEEGKWSYLTASFSLLIE